MKKIGWALPLIIPLLSLAQQNPASLLWNPKRLAACRQKYHSGDPATTQGVARLRTQADHLLDISPLSVMDKSITPPSGSKHDYMSQAPYFWYDSSKPNGLPYIRRDGQRNPETYKIPDHKNLAELGSRVQTLALTAYLTDDNRYAEKAAQFLHHWFLDDATRMNPNLEYGQGIPGINTGRGIGIIETIPLIGIANAASLLESCTASAGAAANAPGSAAQAAANSPWSASDAKALRAWYSQYLEWMLTSKNGQEEHQAANNHGTWFLAQATAIALYTGDLANAASLLESCTASAGAAANAPGSAAQAAAANAAASTTHAAANSPWSTSDAKALRAWYSQYLEWMLTSKNGQEEHQAANNHGTWFLAQATAIALYTGDLANAHNLAEEGKAKMDHQIQADGKMPEELARTNGLGYSTYNLQAFFTLARLAAQAGVDIWHYTDAQQGSLHTAFNWLLPYALGQKTWEYQQIGPYNKDELYPLLLQAYAIYSDKDYLIDAQLILPNGGDPITEIAWGLRP